MSKAALHFDLDEPHDRDAFGRCARVDEAFDALWDIDQAIRARLKHDLSPPFDDKTLSFLEELRERIHRNGIMELYT